MLAHHRIRPLVLSALLSIPLGVIAAPAYTMLLLPEGTGANDISSVGHVVLSTSTGAALWAPNSYSILGGLNGGYSDGMALNRYDEVAGTSYVNGESQAFAFTGNTLRDIRAALTGFSSSFARGINDAGQVVGGAYGANNVPGVPNGDTRAYIYQAGAVKILSTLGGARSIAVAINKHGTVAGTSTFAGANQDAAINHAFLYRHDVMTDLGTLAGDSHSVASAINDHGDVTGASYTLPSPVVRGYIYVRGKMTDIGNLGGHVTTPSGMNNRGDVVGYGTINNDGDFRAFLYSGGAMVDLNTLVAGRDGWILTSAADINDRGQIVGAACRQAQCRAVLLNRVDHKPAL